MSIFLRTSFKVSVAILLFFLSSAESNSQDVSCENFKEGNFAYTEEENKHWKIERLGAYQFEHSEEYDVLFVASLEWIDECSYLLQYVSISNSKYFDAYGKLLHCEVIPIDDFSYEVVVDDEGEILTYVMETAFEKNMPEVKNASATH